MFKLNRTKTLTFYMKSGNQIVADGVDPDFTIKYTGDIITEISKFKQSPSCKIRLMLASLNLGQIEAITAR